jgi:catechol 2,3-dioxygenase-like lactoylglutathione lyase family enzyme
MAAMVKTYGLTHINLAVPDIERSKLFYGQVFGAVEIRREQLDEGPMVMLNTPGSRDVVTLWQTGGPYGDMGSLRHFGFRLRDPGDIDRALADVVSAGGNVLRRGDRGSDECFAFVTDPDGYKIELWYED